MASDRLSAEFLNPQGIADYMTSLGIPTSKRQAYRLAADDSDFPTIKIRGKVYARKASIDAYLRKIEARDDG